LIVALLKFPDGPEIFKHCFLDELQRDPRLFSLARCDESGSSSQIAARLSIRPNDDIF
jgi:hypothetical protein